MLATLRTTLASLAGLLALQLPAAAQCPLPDQLDGPCCTAAQPQFPRLTSFSHEAKSICWLNCDVESVDDCIAEWRFPNTTVPYPCRIDTAVLRMLDAAGNIKWRGRLRAQYSRTWLELDSAAGVELQVWRFLLNGDMRPSPGPDPCPVPPSAAAHNNRVKFTGYIDIARDCSTGQRSYAWMLTHACDAIDHVAGFPRGGVFQPDRSYTFVGPGAGFVVTPFVPGEGGGSPIGAVRRVTRIPGTVGLTCEVRERVDHFLQPVNQFCVCAGGVPQWQLSNVQIGGACGSGAFSQNTLLPGFFSMGIGFWTDPTTYPGEEALRWNAAGYQYLDGCENIDREEVFFGVTTVAGYTAFDINTFGGAPLPPTFIDQGNAQRNGTPVLNLPWRYSSHIINLNH